MKQDEKLVRIGRTIENFYVQKMVSTDLIEAILYSINAGGKRIRPLLLLELLEGMGLELTEAHFQVAAALEMKEKVRSAVLKELEATESGNRSERTYLSEQLRNFGSAYISTFHSFALGIIRKHYYICGLSPNFKVAEQEVTELLKQEALDNIFETEFDNKRKDFYSFNGKYSSSRNNYGARELIKSTYEFIQSLPDPKKWINEKIRYGDMIVVSDMIVELIIRKLAVAEHYVSRIMALLDESATPGTFGNYFALHDEISKLKQDISSSAFKLGKENYDVIGKRLSELNFSYMIFSS